jgi:hypothetical protein
MVRPMGDGSAAREEEVTLAADAEPSSRDAIMSTTRAGIDRDTDSVPEHVPHQRRSRGETILVVEDEEALREAARRIFVRTATA